MTSLVKKNNSTNVHSHIQKAYDFLDEFLPKYYVELVQKKFEQKFPEKPVPSSGVLRNIRNRSFKSAEKRFDIITVMVEVANDVKSELENITNIIT